MKLFQNFQEMRKISEGNATETANMIVEVTEKFYGSF